MNTPHLLITLLIFLCNCVEWNKPINTHTHHFTLQCERLIYGNPPPLSETTRLELKELKITLTNRNSTSRFRIE